MAKLSREYTNHSCRATTVYVMDEAQVPSRHIMSVTGHKSESSLKTYSGKTCEKNKKFMSETISEKTLENHQILVISRSMILCLTVSTFLLCPRVISLLKLTKTRVQAQVVHLRLNCKLFQIRRPKMY